MSRIFKGRKKFAVLGVVAALAVAAVAFAYFTGSGSDTGTATAGTTDGLTDWTVDVSAATDDLYPGGDADALSGTIDNNTPGALGLGSVTVAITAGDINSGPGTCNAEDNFSLDGGASAWVVASGGQSATYTYDPVLNVNKDGSEDLPSGLSIQMDNDPNASQDDCQDQSVEFTTTAS